MYISKLSLINYRNFANTKLIFKNGINTIIGENGSGKSNVFRAIRLLLDDNLLRYAYKLEEKDFFRGIGDWRGHWIIISLEFDEISNDEAIQSLFLHGAGIIAGSKVGVDKATYNLIFRPKFEKRLQLSQLDSGDHEGLAAIRQSITLEDYETIITGKSEADFNDDSLYKTIVGDFENAIFNEELEFPEIGAKTPGILSLAKEISFTFVQALRDVIGEFQNNRTNPLLTLLKSKSGEIDETLFQPIANMVTELNKSIEVLPDVQTIRNDITQTIKEMAGETYSPTSLSIKSDLSNEADKLFQSLKLFIGESEPGYEGSIHELSLGGANLIYLTLKLLEFKYQKNKESFANFLLIEEPEAHIHTHIQKTLFDKLQYDHTQIIYTTHSTQISEVSNVENINILGKHYGKCEAYQPSIGLTPTEVGNIQRYLDAVRSNLLFAKSVILVEGDAEEILIPILVKKVLGVSLDELGVSLVNIRSTGFNNVAILFHDARIHKKCSIITDSDAAIINIIPNTADSPKLAARKLKCSGSATAGVLRKTALEDFHGGNPWIKSFFAKHTFEVDYVMAGNAQQVIDIVDTVYTNASRVTLSKSELASADVAVYGTRVLTMAKNVGKGWFAILLGKHVDSKTIIPNYILDALFFAYPQVSTEVWCHILNYRLNCILKQGPHMASDVAKIQSRLTQYRNGALLFEDIRNEMFDLFPTDGIYPILMRF
jgi:putative ATP-dependent endonuclease of OLD family